MPHTAIILAGGFGTRLQSEVADVPKPLAPIGDIPFLDYLLDYAQANVITHVILAVSYKRELIETRYKNQYNHIKISYSVEDEPLGTGGAIYQAMKLVEEDECWIFNGDSFFDVNLTTVKQFHKLTNADATISLKRMRDFDRYGTVKIDDKARVTSFEEKQPTNDGLINGGIYLMPASLHEKIKAPAQKFSFEQDILAKYFDDLHVSGYQSTGYFIDIGIPEDYARAQIELPRILIV